MIIGGHVVRLEDNGTMDTVISVDGKRFIYSEVDRTTLTWLTDLMQGAVSDYEIDAMEEI